MAAAFSSYPTPLRARLLALRRLIFVTASATEGVGRLDQTIKWRQVSYLTSESKSGSTIRIDCVKSAANQYAVYFHCQTNLVVALIEVEDQLERGALVSIARAGPTRVRVLPLQNE